jgi:IclR family pca regulon transcriptional regulator
MNAEPEAEAEGRTEYNQGLARGLELIRAFTDERPRLTVAEAAQATGMTRATARRALLTLEDLGYARREGRAFSLTPKILSLGYSFLASQRIESHVLPILKDVTEATGESCSLGMVEGDEIVYAAISPAPQRLLSLRLTVGSRLPLLTTSMGRAALAAMAQSRRDALLAEGRIVRHNDKTMTDRAQIAAQVREAAETGFAVSDGELDVALRSVSVAVLGRDRQPVGAVSLGAVASRVSLATMIEKFLPPLRRAARAVGEALP